MPTSPPYTTGPGGYGSGHGSAAGIPSPPSAGTSVRPGPPVRQKRRWIRLAVLVPVVVLVATIAYLAGGSKNDDGLAGLRPGDCIAAPDTSGFTKVDAFDCSKVHTQEVYAVGTTKSKIATGGDAINDPEIIRICKTDVDPKILRVLAHATDVAAGFLVDSSKSGRVVCTAISDTPRTGSYVAAAHS
ncbi:MAG: hypothetical protein JWM34_2985 [Ilumatobacteraceae bacterium]|nr:hypothetical protein [Ilumatobacteraceae bacterium]